MNNRKPPFHFEDGNPIDREKIWKRFGFSHNPEEDRRMFEPSPTNHPGWPGADWQSKFYRPPQFEDPEWRSRSAFTEPGSGSPSFTRRMRMGPNWAAEDEAPFRGGHERTPPMEDGNDSETSSQASHGSQGSSASGTGQPMKAKISREPRVHHIPIMVEPRDGSSSSGYASDGGGANNQANHNKQQAGPASGANLSKQNSVDSNMDTEDYPAPNVHQLKKNFEQGQQQERRRESSVRTIPIKVMRDEAPSVSPRSHQPPARSFSANCFGTNHSDMPTSPRQRKASSHPPMSSPSSTFSAPRSSPNGPHVTKIPVNVQQQKREISPEASTEKENHARVKSTPDPLDEIKHVLEELNPYTKQIEEFTGKPQDKAYRYLDEMLTRLMLKLDNVETNGQDNIRQARKAAVRDIESWISVLEAKANNSSSNTVSNKSLGTVPMEAEVESGKPHEGQQAEQTEDKMTLDNQKDACQEPQSTDESMETDNSQKVTNPENDIAGDSQPTTDNQIKESSPTAHATSVEQ